MRKSQARLPPNLSHSRPDPSLSSRAPHSRPKSPAPRVCSRRGVLFCAFSPVSGRALCVSLQTAQRRAGRDRRARRQPFAQTFLRRSLPSSATRRRLDQRKAVKLMFGSLGPGGMCGKCLERHSAAENGGAGPSAEAGGGGWECLACQPGALLSSHKRCCTQYCRSRSLRGKRLAYSRRQQPHTHCSLHHQPAVSQEGSCGHVSMNLFQWRGSCCATARPSTMSKSSFPLKLVNVAEV